MIMKQAQVPSWLGNYPQALRWITRGLAVLEGVGGDEVAIERARLYALYGSIRMLQGRPPDAITWCRRAVQEGEPVGAQEALAHAYFILDWAYASLGRYEEADLFAAGAHDVRGDRGHSSHGDGSQQHGDVRSLPGALGRCAGLVRPRWGGMGQDRQLARLVATLNVGEVLADQGRVDEAEKLLRDALRVARASRSASRMAEVALTLGRLLSRTGRFEEAHVMFSEGAGEYQGEADAREAECLMLEGRAEEALALSTSALERGIEGGFHLRVMLLRTQGCALLQLGRLDEAKAALDDALEEARTRSLAYEAALTLDALGRLAHVTEHPAIELEQERDAILGRLGVVRLPEIPLPKIATKAG